ncbi:MAG: alpha/beta hydrolase [Candidatus Heteroscillospira sp.]|jgi:pimeloyl-ACP methyl ester carboxylesterase
MEKFNVESPAGVVTGGVLLGGCERVLIAAHGFGSCALSRTNRLLMDTMPQSGWGVAAFDFPGHGDSSAPPEALRIESCLDALEAVENLVQERYPGAETAYFGSSFGAYITAIYLSRRGHRGKRAFFRSAAVTMPDILLGQEWPGAAEQLSERGWFSLDYPGYQHPLAIPQGFLDDLRETELFEVYGSDAELAMIHGDADETVPYEAARRFAEKFGARLITVPGGHHALDEGNQRMETAEALLAFLNGRG